MKENDNIDHQTQNESIAEALVIIMPVVPKTAAYGLKVSRSDVKILQQSDPAEG